MEYRKNQRVYYIGRFKKSHDVLYNIVAKHKTKEGYVYDIKSFNKPSGLFYNQFAEHLHSVTEKELKEA